MGVVTRHRLIPKNVLAIMPRAMRLLVPRPLYTRPKPESVIHLRINPLVAPTACGKIRAMAGQNQSPETAIRGYTSTTTCPENLKSP